jgi:hypothetical protein
MAIYELVMVWEESKRYFRRKKWLHGQKQNGQYDEINARGEQRTSTPPRAPLQ